MTKFQEFSQSRMGLSLGVEFVVCFVADAKVIPEGWAVTSPCRHEFALHVSVCVFHFWSEPWWFFFKYLICMLGGMHF